MSDGTIHKKYDLNKDADALFGRDVLEKLGTRHGFNYKTTNFEWWSHKAAIQYLRAYRSNDVRTSKKILTKKRKKMAKLASELSDCIHSEDDIHLALALHSMAEMTHQPVPQQKVQSNEFHPLHDLTAFQDELIRLLRLLSCTINWELHNQTKATGGRPKNAGLIRCVTYLADFWEGQTNRRFTFDHLDGAPLTPAFEFVLDFTSILPGVQEKNVRTAMRTVVAERATYINRPKKR